MRVPQWRRWTGSTRCCSSIRLYSSPASDWRGRRLIPAQTGYGSARGGAWCQTRTGSAPGSAHTGYNCFSLAPRPPVRRHYYQSLSPGGAKKPADWSPQSSPVLTPTNQFKPVCWSSPVSKPRPKKAAPSLKHIKRVQVKGFAWLLFIF